MPNYQLQFPTFNNGEKTLGLNPGEMILVVGANGTGKSSLMQRFASHNPNKCLRLTAHRQIWFNSNIIEITPLARVQVDQNIRSQDQQTNSRYMDHHAAQRSQVTIFDLVDSENVESRKIADAARAHLEQEVTRLINIPSPISKMNSILKSANLNIKISIDSGSKVMATRAESEPYSIAELSDGERNAILIIANVLTAPEGTLIILDEPERHLHRSIVSPLLTTLLAERNDCAFIVSTHDISLLIDQKKASALLLREYRHPLIAWDADVVEAIGDIDETISSAILGARRTILFVEGTATSLDRQIYQILYPEVSIIPAGSCVEVERAVKGIRSTVKYNWLSAYGLIDRDSRTEQDVTGLEADGVFALDLYSVESLYYHHSIMAKVAYRTQQYNGKNAEVSLSQANERAISAIAENKEALAAKVAEGNIRKALLQRSPSWKELQNISGTDEINVSLSGIVAQERERINGLIENKDLASLIKRYPVRESQALVMIAKALGFEKREIYESTVRKLLLDDEETRNEMRCLIQPLTIALAS